MPSNQIRKRTVDAAAKTTDKSGFTVDPGPYLAVVVGHPTGARMGQLIVWIPEFGGVPTSTDDQRVVSYASPFFGQTFGTDSQAMADGAFTNGQSYGMWFVPPDVGNKVLVTFAAGDTSRGYWFACVYDTPSHHMVPGVSSNVSGNDKTYIDPNVSPSALTNGATSGSIFPTVEASIDKDTSSFPADMLTNSPRYAHPIQSTILINQGLDRDPIRGATSSSSLREAPSNVYGISTPGPSATKTPQGSSSAGDPYDSTQITVMRQGGHTFVMDDGNPNKQNAQGNNVDQLIRLRTSGGHQILMNDSEQVLYIASASGYQWLEFSNDGSMNIFAAAGFNVRSEGLLNFHSDSGILMNSPGVIEINADKGVAISSKMSVGISAAVSASVHTDGMLNLSSVGAASLVGGLKTTVSAIGRTDIFGATVNLNSPAPIPVPPTPAMPAKTNSLPDVTFNGNYWEFSPGAIQSVCMVVPAHEPWIDPSTGFRPVPPNTGSGGSLLKNIAIGVVEGAVASMAAQAEVAISGLF